MASLESAENHKLSNKISIDKHRHLLVPIGLFAGLSLLLFSILLYFAIVRPNKNDSVCLTRDCTLTASTLVSAMDPSYDPCEDFFKFTCANFIRKTPFPTDIKAVSPFIQYMVTFNLQLKNLIEDYNPYGEPDVVYRLLETYHLCLNTSEDNNKELTAFKEFIVDVFDGWPMATGSQWKFRFNNLTDYFANIYRYGFYPNIFYVDLNYTSWDADTKEFITKPGLHVFFDFAEMSTLSIFNNDDEEADTEVGESDDERKTLEIQKAKQKVIMELMKPFGNPTPFAVTRAINQIKEFVSFTNELLKKIGKSDNFTELNIRDMNEQSDLDWLKIFTSKYPNEAADFSLDTKVQVRNAEMLHELPKIFEKYPVKVFIDLLIANLMTANNLLDFTTPNIVKAVNEYQELLLRENYIPRKRWEFCLKKIREYYPMVLTRMFINKFVDKNGKTIVDEMIQMIQEAYKQRILDSDWLDESTKERAVRKAEAIKRFVAYPASIFDDKILEEFYKYIPTVRSTWLWHIINLRENRSNRNFDGEDEIYKWSDPLDPNAYYNVPQNTIRFPSGILQLPFFNENRLASVNFGMIGAVIGHEIGHAFDNWGKHFNEKGEEEMWWTNNTAEEFKTRSQCFINQYEKYCPEDLQGGVNDTVICVNGDRTLGENLADSTGLSAAYDAYQMWIRKNGNEPRLPGLEMYSPEQVLFISFGYIYCENTPPDVWYRLYKYDPHSPDRYRSIGTLSNNLIFRKAFNCPEGPMNRGENSCALWGK